MLEKISKRKSTFLRAEHSREVMGEAVHRDITKQLRSAEAARASDAQEHSRSLAAAEAQLEEKQALLTHVEE